MLTGLGLQNSINDIIDVQYGELVDYNVVISEKDDAADDESEAAAALLGDAEKLPEILNEAGVTAFMFKKDTPGVSFGEPMKKMGQRAIVCREFRPRSAGIRNHPLPECRSELASFGVTAVLSDREARAVVTK